MEEQEAVRDAATTLRSAAAAEALLLDVVQRHAEEVMRIARTHSLCLDDAHDAYQRSLEQFLRHGRRLERATAHRWLFTVVKREAMAVRRARAELVGDSEVDFERLEARAQASPEERALTADAVARGAEALRALKPQEIRVLWLRADGHSYAEIQQATGFSYTKVNRCLSEGRRRFLRRCAELETGQECERWAVLLARHADGVAPAQEVLRLRPHLRACASCRATLRGLHAAPDAVGVLLPPGLLGVGAVRADEGAAGWLARAWDALAAQLQERAVAAAHWPAASEAVAGGKLAAVAASSVALVGGGAVVAQERPGREGARSAAASRPAARAAAAPRRARASVAVGLQVAPAPRGPTAPAFTPRPVAAPGPAPAPVPRRRVPPAPPAAREFELVTDAEPRGTAAPAPAAAVSREPAPPAPAEFAPEAPAAPTGSAASASQPAPGGGEFGP